MKILIIDDQVLFAEGMTYLLESFDQEIITLYAEDYESAIKAIDKFGCPDLILLGVNLSGSSGFSLIDKFHRLNIWSPILIISATDLKYTADMSLQKGAQGFVSKASDALTLRHAIETVLAGNNYMSETDTPDKKQATGSAKVSVTRRQQEILFLLSQGLLNKQIAYELSISTNTVKAHLHEIFKQLNVKNRTAAVQTAYNYGLV